MFPSPLGGSQFSKVVREIVTYSGMHIVTVSLCPCGDYSRTIACRCTLEQIQSHISKIAPILSKSEMVVPVEAEFHWQLWDAQPEPGYCDDRIIERSAHALLLQIREFGKPASKLGWNILSKTDPNVVLTLRKALNGPVSAQTVISTIRIAYSIASLESTLKIETRHIIEAIQYTTWREKL